MNIQRLLYKVETGRKSGLLMDKGNFIRFVGDQFKRLAKKNLNLPITLYHL